jgi:hypothetical protein
VKRGNRELFRRIVGAAVPGIAATLLLFWVDDAEERERLRAYALSLSGGAAAGFLVFASYANRGPVCDALSPVWLSDLLLAGALMYGLAWVSPGGWKRRLALAVIAGIIIAAFHALMWPQCLHRPEGVSPEVDRLWLSHVKEARPFYRHGWRIATLIIALPVTGAIGWILLAWVKRGNRELFRRIVGAAVPGIAATLLLFWQTRTGPAAQMMATVGAAALMWLLIPLAWNLAWPNAKLSALVRALATSAILVIGAGGAVPVVVGLIPEKAPTQFERSIGRANGQCGSLWGLHPIALQPKGMVFTFIDLGPRLITVTHHDAVGGPYHRNGQQIADVMNAFRGSADQAHRLIGKYHSNYLLICPNSSTTTIFLAEAPKGFYAQLAHGQVPNRLQPVQLPKDSPYQMWKVVG